MANPALELEHVTVAQLENYASARRAGRKRGALRSIAFFHFFKILFHSIHRLCPPAGSAARLRVGVILDESNQRRRDFVEWQAVVRFSIRQCTARHIGMHCVLRILDDPYSTISLDCQQSGGAVIQEARQDDSDHTPAMSSGSAAKEDVNRRPKPVFSRS